MNTKFLLRDVLSSLKKLDQQGHYKIADKIFNNVRTAQEVTPKTYDKLLQQVYGRLRAEVNRSENSNNFYNSDPISNLNADITIEEYDSGFAWDEHFKLNEDQIIAIYSDYLKWSKYYSTSNKTEKEPPPIRVSFTENDVEDIISALIQFGSEQAGKVTEVTVQFNYTDKDGKEKGWHSSESFRAGLIEDDEEMRGLLE